MKTIFSLICSQQFRKTIETNSFFFQTLLWSSRQHFYDIITWRVLRWNVRFEPSFYCTYNPHTCMGLNKNLGTNSWSSFFPPTEIFSTCLKWSQGARIRGHDNFLDIVTVSLFGSSSWVFLRMPQKLENNISLSFDITIVDFSE